jgi:signal transduction histidine kinase
MGQVEFVEIIIDEAPLRNAMLGFAGNILLLSLMISAITAGLVFLALHWLIVKPVRRLAGAITAFEAEPDNPGRILTPSGRRDEIGEAEAALARMETTLAGEFRRKAHLAALGLAVSKINHDLRNMLASAQLWSDRLTESPDPQVRRFAPRLIATLDRAIAFCQATLSYGRATEQPPQRRQLKLRGHVEDVAAILGLDGETHRVRFDNRIAPGFSVEADADQLSRVLTNLLRNALEALTRAGSTEGEPTITVEAMREVGGVRLVVRDNGPGLPEQARAHLFEAFKGSTSAGGSGLGLAIAAELVLLHGGSIRLDPQASGACFVITLPDKGQG